jgi:hypothetical protein
MAKAHGPTGTLAALVGQASGYVTRNFAFQHLKAAKYFAKQAETIEQDPQNHEFGIWFEKFQCYFVGSIIMSCSALEATYSEMVVSCKLHRALLEERGKLTNRFRLLNEHVAGSPVVLGRPPGQHLEAILALRDFMVHPEPGSDLDPGKHTKVVRLIKKMPNGGSEIESQLFKNEVTVYRYYTCRCSNWVVATAQEFITEILQKTGQDKKAAMFSSA